MWGRLSATLPQSLKRFLETPPRSNQPHHQIQEFPVSQDPTGQKFQRSQNSSVFEGGARRGLLSFESVIFPTTILHHERPQRQRGGEERESARALYTPRMGTVFR